MIKPTDEEINNMIEKLAMFKEHKCKSVRCALVHQRMIDTLEWIMGRRRIP